MRNVVNLYYYSLWTHSICCTAAMMIHRQVGQAEAMGSSVVPFLAHSLHFFRDVLNLLCWENAALVNIRIILFPHSLPP